MVDTPDQAETPLPQYTVARAAKVLGVSPRQVRRYLDAGGLEGVRVSGPNGPEWRISGASLQNFRARRREGVVRADDRPGAGRPDVLASVLRDALAGVAQEHAEDRRSFLAALDQAQEVGRLQERVRVLEGQLAEATAERDRLRTRARELREERDQARAELAAERGRTRWPWQRTRKETAP